LIVFFVHEVLFLLITHIRVGPENLNIKFKHQ
jgi:hypothetical protein